MTLPGDPSVVIRLASLDDAPAIAAIYAPIVTDTAISFETQAPGEEEIRRRIAEALELYPWLVLVRQGTIAGFAYASRHRTRAAYQWSVDTTVYVDEPFRRQGIGRGLYLSLFAILTAQGFVNAYAGIALPNPASIALHEQIGFTPVGIYRNVGYKLGAWRDVAWFQRALNPCDGPPPAIRSVEEMCRAERWPDLLRHGSSVVRA